MATIDKAVARQAVTGLVSPSIGEAKIRESFPAFPGVAAAPAALSKALVQTVLLAPLGWLLIQAPLFALKFAPFVCKRYTLTNRRLMVQRGWRPAMVQQVELKEIDDVRLVVTSQDAYYLCGTLEVIGRGGQVLLTLTGVQEPEGFRHAVVNAVKAWVPDKAKGAWIAASAKV